MSQAASISARKRPKILEKQMYTDHCLQRRQEGSAPLSWHRFILSLSQIGPAAAPDAPDNYKERMLRWRSSSMIVASSKDVNSGAEGTNQTNHLLRHSSSLEILHHANEEYRSVGEHLSTLVRSNSPDWSNAAGGRDAKRSPTLGLQDPRKSPPSSGTWRRDKALGVSVPAPIEENCEEANEAHAEQPSFLPDPNAAATIGFPSAPHMEPLKSETPDSTSPRLSAALALSILQLDKVSQAQPHPAGSYACESMQSI